MKKEILIISIAALMGMYNAQAQPCTTNVQNPNNGVATTVPVYTGAACINNSQITDNVDVFIGTGSLDLSIANQSYKINTQPVLWHNNITSNIFVGVGAGNGLASGTWNTLVGNNAGNLLSTGYDNTVIGSGAGHVLSVGERNTLLRKKLVVIFLFLFSCLNSGWGSHCFYKINFNGRSFLIEVHFKSVAFGRR